MTRLISVLFILLFMLLATFALLTNITGTSFAPFIDSNINGLTTDEPESQVPETPGISAPPGIANAAGPELEPPDEARFATIQMDVADIYRGNLILVNNDNGCELPDESELVDIAEFKTQSYRVSGSSLLLLKSVIEPLNNMMDAFYDETGCADVAIISAYRDYDRQQKILDEYVATLGREEAKKRVSLPGHSEHNSGIAVDFGVFVDGEIKTFFQTGANGWLFVNSYRYGFIPRYPEEKTEITKIAHEPWHFRYVGTPHAYFIYNSGMCLEEYIDFIRGFRRDEPYRASYDGEDYEVYFTRDTRITLPDGQDAQIAGNNVDGFIVTIKL
ncbi:MAG: M15 family metallopeptidase [Oscillospiraceae bacterium]|nr:M15 family metallopeptidase [Oscillospiraceae bacterium]